MKFKMALKYSKQLYLVLNKNCMKSLLPILGNNAQPQIQLVHYCDSAKQSNVRINEAIKNYLEKARKYNEFLKEQLEEYKLGKQFLASMMGDKKRNMTQKEVDEAIEYLFPSRLFVPKARPFMKEPCEIFQYKEASFDLTGRPYNFLFYTSKQNYCQCLHDAAVMLENLNSRKINPNDPPKPLALIRGKWFTKEELKAKFNESLLELEYEKFLEVFNALAKHPFASEAEEFIYKYRKNVDIVKKTETSENIVCNDGVKTVTIARNQRKTSFATVSVSHPGSGQIQINNMGLDYFSYINSRRQVSVKSVIFKRNTPPAKNIKKCLFQTFFRLHFETGECIFETNFRVKKIEEATSR